MLFDGQQGDETQHARRAPVLQQRVLCNQHTSSDVKVDKVG
jgi:hypothetical protein